MIYFLADFGSGESAEEKRVCGHARAAGGGGLARAGRVQEEVPGARKGEQVCLSGISLISARTVEGSFSWVNRVTSALSEVMTLISKMFQLW